MSVKIQLCNKISRLPFYSTQKDGNGITIPKIGINWIEVPEAKGEFTEETKDTDGGTVWVQKLDIFCELPTADNIAIATIPHVFRLSFSDGTIATFGSTDNPVNNPKMKGTLSQKQISFDHNSLAPIY